MLCAKCFVSDGAGDDGGQQPPALGGCHWVSQVTETDGEGAELWLLPGDFTFVVISRDPPHRI